MEYSLFYCVLSIALNVASVLIASYSVGPSLYAVLPVAITIMHFNGTSISLHNIHVEVLHYHAAASEILHLQVAAVASRLRDLNYN